MAKISLRAYNHEIENLVDQNQFDQAIAHARHILNIFPKHLQTYRLLGKAYLESQRYGDAADIFQRVLSSIPDDFVSHVGMSIVREDEGNLDVAIWHMERAFEAQPANVAIQGELRRLYGKRDGLEPPKVRLTRGALARMYIKGELYAQAITEIRTALAEDADRSDLMVLLAQAYFLSNQRVEAANTCSSILQKLPNCYEANRILAEILAKSERANEAEDYRKRLQLLDPYYTHIPPGAVSPDKAPETAIQIERLVWTPGQSLTGGPAQPEWAASLGVDLEATPEKESLPDWLLDSTEVEPEVEGADESPAISVEEEEEQPEEETEELSAPAEDALPEWMKAAGWQQAGEDEETGVIPEFEAQGEIEDLEATPADIPEWLKEIAPPEQATDGEEPSSAETPELESLPDMPWMEENLPIEDAVPDWLESPSEAEISDSVPDAQAGPEAEPDLLAGLAEAGESVLPTEISDIPEREDAAAIIEAAGEAPEGEPEGKTLDDEDAFAWLENLAARQGASEAMLLQPEERRETPPDWVVEGSMESAEPGEVNEPPGTELVEPVPLAEAEFEEPTTEVPGWIDELASEQPALQAEISEIEEEAPAEVAEMPDWLRELGPSGPDAVAEETQLTELDEREVAGTEPAQLPDWLHELAPEAEEQPGESALEVSRPVESHEEPEGQLPDWLRSATDETSEEISAEKPSAEMPDMESVEEEAEWLSEEFTQATFEEETPPGAEASRTELPDWLRSLSEGGVDAELSSEVSSVEAESGAEPAVLPDWLSGIQETAPQVTEEAEAPAAEFGMLFGPQELARIPAEDAEKIHIEEPPVLAGDTQPSRVRHAEEQVEPSAPPSEAPSGLAEEAVEAITFPSFEPEEEKMPSADLIPDWLKGLGEEPTHEEAVTEEMGTIQAALEPATEALNEMAIQQEVESAFPEKGIAKEPSEPESIMGHAETVEPVEGEEEALPAAAEEAGVPLDDESAFAWLESLAAKQGAEEALLLKPEERSEEPPEWIQKALEGAESAPVESEASFEAAPPEEFPVEAAPVESEAISPAEPIELNIAKEVTEAEMPTEEIPAEELAEAVPPFSEEAEAPAFEEEYGEAPVELEAPIEAAPPAMLSEAPEVTEATPELPSWLAGVEDTRTIEEETIWSPPAEAEQTAEVGAKPEIPVSERLDLNRAGLIELERLPGVGFVRAQEILNYRQVHGPFFSIDELAEVPGIDADLVSEIRDQVQVEFEEAEAEEATPVPSEEEDIAIIQARNALIQGDTQTAIGYYEQLISARQFLPEVIRDLNEALYRYPADVSFWQALGDAQVRAGNLQEALDAYTKAEELLR